MRISIYNPDLVKVADIGDCYISCLWNEEYNADGAFCLELRATDAYKRNITPDCYAKRHDTPGLMIIKSVNVSGKSMVLSGKSAAAVLEDVAFVGSTTANTVVATELKSAYDSTNGYQNVTFAESDLTDTYGDSIENKSMHDMLAAMCLATDMGYRAVKTGSGIEIQLYKPGVNENARFSHFLGNLKEPEVNISTSGYKNYAIVVGKTSGGAVKRVDVDWSDGQQHREIIISGRSQGSDESSTAFEARLRSIGVNKLAESLRELNCSFVPSAAGFGGRFELGDIATIVLDDYGIKLQARIISFTEKSQNNKSKTTIEVGTPTVISR